MTFNEAIRTNPTFLDVPDEVIEVAFINRNVEGTDEYTNAGLKNLELVTADLYVEIATQPKIKEGGLSAEWNPSLLLGRARNIYLKYEDPRLTDTGGRKIDLTITKQ